MSKLIYINSASLDGYVEDATGAFDWVNPEQIHEFITELIRPMGTYLYARVWQKAQKVVFSRTLVGVTTRNTRLERDFDPAAIAKLKRESKHDIDIGGAELAGLAFEADLIDEYHLFLHPVIVGGGKPALPTGLRRKFELLETKRFNTGVIHAHYRILGGNDPWQ